MEDNRILKNNKFMARCFGTAGWNDKFVILCFGKLPEGTKAPVDVNDIASIDYNFDLMRSGIMDRENGLRQLRELRENNAHMSFFLYDEDGPVNETELAAVAT